LSAILELRELTITPRLIGCFKDEGAEWSTVTPLVKKALRQLFGRKARISECQKREMSDKASRVLGRAAMGSLREALEGCALTEDEKETIYG
jgi:hypothetical protein